MIQEKFLSALRSSRNYHAENRLLSYFDATLPVDQCWNWSPVDKYKYGKYSIRVEGVDKTYRAHRAVYCYYNGTIPENTLVCHSCDNPSCVNPNHLFLGTTLDNVRDKISKDRGSNKLRLTEDQYLILLYRCKSGAESRKKIAKDYKVSHDCLRRYLKKKQESRIQIGARN